MNFLEAVEQMKQGKKVRSNQHENTLPWVYSNGEFYIIKENGDRIISHLSMCHFEATDWEVVEEPKKTLSDMIQQIKVNKLNVEVIDVVDVREALKEFIDSLNQLENSYVNRKAKEIFGEELLK